MDRLWGVQVTATSVELLVQVQQLEGPAGPLHYLLHGANSCVTVANTIEQAFEQYLVPCHQ
jgi:hypothetical protein